MHSVRSAFNHLYSAPSQGKEVILTIINVMLILIVILVLTKYLQIIYSK